MASRYYALEIGDNEYEVAEGASLVAIDNIKNYILRDIWPPA